MKTDKSAAQDIAAKEWNNSFDYRSLRNGVQVGNIKMIHLDGVNERAMDIYAAQEVAKYKTVIEKLLPLAEAGSAYYRQNPGFDWVAEKEKSKIIINEAHDLLKLTSGNDPQSYADRD